MRSRALSLAAVAAVAAVAVWAGTGREPVQSALARVTDTEPGPNMGCVSFGPGATLQLCMHKFEDGTRCVAAGGGGIGHGGNAGAGAAVQCDFAAR